MSAAVRNCFDLQAVQLEADEMKCHIDFIAAGNTFMYLEHYPRRTHLTGELLSNRFGIAVPVAGPNFEFAGEQMDRCRLASAMTGEEMDVLANSVALPCAAARCSASLHRKRCAGFTRRVFLSPSRGRPRSGRRKLGSIGADGA